MRKSTAIRFLAITCAVLIICGISDSRADVTATATATVTLTIEPYASIELEATIVNVDLETSGSVTVNVGGTVKCNFDFRLYAYITAPNGASGNWSANANPPGVQGPVEAYYYNLLQIKVGGLGGGFDEDYDISVAPGVYPPAPDESHAIITIVPQ